MKTLKFQKLTLAIAIITLCFNCTTETDIDEPVNKTLQHKDGIQASGCDDKEILTIYIEYIFPSHVVPDGSLMTMEQQTQSNYKADYQHLLSKTIRICLIETSNCDNVEKWIVNAEDYNQYVIDGGHGQGTSNNVVVEGPGEIIPFASCF